MHKFLLLFLLLTAVVSLPRVFGTEVQKESTEEENKSETGENPHPKEECWEIEE
ncbi:hypothetical protein [Chlamydia vaughanii]|uniref:hypothetical protein n=1 Tax=Chlamydia vaughanii TaxID=3112552 RepID=UPI0032B23ABE